MKHSCQRLTLTLELELGKKLIEMGGSEFPAGHLQRYLLCLADR